MQRASTAPQSGPARPAGQAYFVGFTLPNFYFHLTTAYDILRHNGVPVQTTDFTGPF